MVKKTLRNGNGHGFPAIESTIQFKMRVFVGDELKFDNFSSTDVEELGGLVGFISEEEKKAEEGDSEKIKPLSTLL